MDSQDISKFNSEQIVELQNRVTELEMIINNLRGFMKNQIQINEFFRRIVDVKYTKEELLDIYNEYEAKKSKEKETENIENIVENGKND